MRSVGKVQKAIIIVLAVIGGIVVVGFSALALLFSSIDRKIDASRQVNQDKAVEKLLSHLERSYGEEFLVKAAANSNKYFLVAPAADPELEFHAKVSYKLYSDGSIPNFGDVLDDDYKEVGIRNYYAILSQRYPELDLILESHFLGVRVKTYEDIDLLYPRLKEIDVVADQARPFCTGIKKMDLELRIYGPDIEIENTLQGGEGSQPLYLPQVVVDIQEFSTRFETAEVFHGAVVRQYVRRLQQTSQGVSQIPPEELEKFPADNFSVISVNGEAFLNVRYDGSLRYTPFMAHTPKRYEVIPGESDNGFFMERHAIFDMLTDLNVTVQFDGDKTYVSTDYNLGYPEDTSGSLRRDKEVEAVYEWVMGEDHYSMSDADPDVYTKNGSSYDFPRHTIDDSKMGMNSTYALEDIARMLDAELSFDPNTGVLTANSPSFSMDADQYKVSSVVIQK